jgi:isoleucyl-tRNA synthetase
LVFVSNEDGVFVKRIKPDFKKLGPKYGKIMKLVAARITGFSQAEIAQLEKDGVMNFEIEGQPVEITTDDVEIQAQDIPGWVVANFGALTVALDIEVTEELKNEGYAREFVKLVQTYRKENNFEVLDKIAITVEDNAVITPALKAFEQHICNETLCTSLTIATTVSDGVEMDLEDVKIRVKIERL